MFQEKKKRLVVAKGQKEKSDSTRTKMRQFVLNSAHRGYRCAQNIAKTKSLQ